MGARVDRQRGQLRRALDALILKHGLTTRDQPC